MIDETQETASASIRSRPIRIAYLLADDDHVHLKLDGIFASSMATWGGRYSLICPCEEGYPYRSYLPWMKSFDADIIYSFIDLTDENLRRLWEEFGPAYLVRHTERYKVEPTSSDFRVEWPLAPLTSLSTTLQYARAFPASAPQPVRVIDYLPGQPHDRFIDDNFGTPYGSFGLWPIPEQIADAVKPLYVASATAPNFSGREKYESDAVNDAAALLHYMAAHRGTYGLAQLSADAAPRIDVHEVGNNDFTLVVGATFADRVAYWNLRSRAPVFLGREVTTLIVDPARLDEEAFFAALAEFMKKRNGVPRSSGTPWVTLCSASLTSDALRALKEKLSAVDKWNGYQIGAAITLETIVPKAEQLERPQQLVMGGLFDRSPEWKDFPASGGKARPPAVVPKHIAHMQSRNYAISGAWALDVIIERQANHSRFDNVRHNWFFPRRLRFHEAFLGAHESRSEGIEFRRTRATTAGYLATFSSFGEELPAIDLPSDERAFLFAMQRGDTFPPFRRLDAWGAPRGPFSSARPSDKGRYLLGALRMFGGLQNAGSVLLHSYWQSIFEEMGGAVGTARQKQIRDTIRKRLRTVATSPPDWDDDTWDRMTAVVASEAHQVRVPQQSLSYDDLLNRHGPYLAKEVDILRERKVEDPDDWIAQAKASLKYGVQNRCAENVLFQGYQRAHQGGTGGR